MRLTKAGEWNLGQHALYRMLRLGLRGALKKHLRSLNYRIFVLYILVAWCNIAAGIILSVCSKHFTVNGRSHFFTISVGYVYSLYHSDMV